MAYNERRIIYDKIAQVRDSTVLAYVNNIALPNAPLCIVSARYINKIISSLTNLKNKLDFIVITNGGDTNAPLRIVSLLRSYFNEINVILPYRCYSAGTALALGCDNVIMLKTANLGPIDPSVTNPHNLDGAGKPLPPISVEEVKSYFKFVKDDVGIKSEGRISEALDKLTDKTSPLALGGVKQGISHAKLIAKNLLSSTKKYNRLKIKRIIDMLSSDFYTHSYPISREEAIERVGLKIIKAEALNSQQLNFSDEVSKIYEDFATELKWDEEWYPQHHIDDITTRAGFNNNQLPIDTDFIQTIIESHGDKKYAKKETIRIVGIPMQQRMQYQRQIPLINSLQRTEIAT